MKIRNTGIKNIVRSLSLLIILLWVGLAVYYSVKFAGSINDQSNGAHHLAWGYLASGIVPVTVVVATMFGKAELWSIVTRIAFYLSIYYWLQSLFGIVLPFVVDVQTSLIYYLAPSILGAVVTIVAYLLAKRTELVNYWIVPVFLTVTTIAMVVAIAA